jgi:uncharacterized protein YjbI with pentapeptide repeats
MNQPKSHSKKDIKKFLIWCSEHQQISNWNAWRKNNKEVKIDMAQIKLHGINLRGANLNEVNLMESELQHSNLQEVQFRNSNLFYADLRYSNLKGADLRNANFRRANLEGVNFDYANLENVDFDGANLDGARLKGALVKGAFFDSKFKIFRNKRTHLNKDKINAEILLRQSNKKLAELQKHLKDTAKNSEENIKLEKEKLVLENENKNLIEKIEYFESEKQKETEDIEKIVKFLGAIPSEISDEQEYLKKKRFWFVLFATFSLISGFSIATIFIINTLTHNKLNLPVITNAGQYLAYALSVVFPIAVSFLFYRQANIKSREIEVINEKSILIQQVENALNSYNVLLSGDELKDKTICSIDLVLNKIFNMIKKKKEIWSQARLKSVYPMYKR